MEVRRGGVTELSILCPPAYTLIPLHLQLRQGSECERAAYYSPARPVEPNGPEQLSHQARVPLWQRVPCRSDDYAERQHPPSLSACRELVRLLDKRAACWRKNHHLDQ